MNKKTAALSVLALLACASVAVHAWRTRFLPRPILVPLSASPGAGGDTAAVKDAEAAVANFFALQDVYILSDAKPPRYTPADAAWATETVRGQADALDRLIPVLKAAVRKDVPVGDAPVPRTYHVSMALYYFTDPKNRTADVWDRAQARANLASALLFIDRSRRSTRGDKRRIAEEMARLPEYEKALAPHPDL